MKRYLAVQIGARRAYAVPSILEDAGMLEAFYTDLVGNAGWGNIASLLPLTFLRRGSVKNLLGRQLPSNLSNKTHTFPGPTLRHFIRSKINKLNPKIWELFGNELADEMIRRGTGQATHLFSMMGECTPFVDFAKRRGLTIVTEFYVMLTAIEILQVEREAFPGMEIHPRPELVEVIYAWMKKVCALTDWAIVPSERVQQDLVENFGVPAERCLFVPYAVNDAWLALENQPVRGRVVLVGTAGLRKGIHYFGMAAQSLRHRGYEFRVAGGVTDTIRYHPLTRNLHFLGRVPRLEIKQEYARADVFVLPSLVEGSAEVTYEALAAGLPVITTPAAGSVVRDGIEGFIVPERDPQALADRIEQLVEDRALRDRMAAAAKERARDYTWEKYAERLVAVFKAV
jgi:glycosyltransferase involved in cell wall biosynthesis